MWARAVNTIVLSITKMNFPHAGPRLSRIVPAVPACPGRPCLRLPSDPSWMLAVEIGRHNKLIQGSVLLRVWSLVRPLGGPGFTDFEFWAP